MVDSPTRESSTNVELAVEAIQRLATQLGTSVNEAAQRVTTAVLAEHGSQDCPDPWGCSKHSHGYRECPSPWECPQHRDFVS
jgi:hypothetical protein